MKPLALQICAAAFAALLAAAAPARGAGTATNRWVRAAGKDARASVAENWSLGHAPKRNEVALFTARHPTAAVWDAAAPREIGGLVLDEGYLFGTQGEGFERINLACPCEVLHEALLRFEAAATSIR